MNVSCFIRRSALESIYFDLARQAVAESFAFQEVPNAIPDRNRAFISGVSLQGVSIEENVDITLMAGYGGERFDQNIAIQMDFVVFISFRGVDVGNAPINTVAFGARIFFRLSMVEPVSAGADLARPELVFKTEDVPDRDLVESPFVGQRSWMEVFGASAIRWRSNLVEKLSVLPMGAFAQPVSATALARQLQGTRASPIFYSPVVLIQDEVHFGLVIGTDPLPVNVILRAIRQFLALGTQLRDGEDCAVVMGNEATTSACLAIPFGVGNYLRRNLAEVLRSPSILRRVGSNVGGTIRFTNPPATQLLGAGTFRASLPLDLTGVCEGAHDRYPSVMMGLDFGLEGQASLTSEPSPTLLIEIVLDADLDQEGVTRCYNRVTASETFVGLLFWPIGLAIVDSGLENAIRDSLFEEPNVTTLASELAPLGGTIARSGSEGIRVSIPVRTNFGAIGPYQFSLQTIRQRLDGYVLRLSGTLVPFATQDSSAEGTLEVRGQDRFFPLVFDGSSVLDPALDCWQVGLSGLEFTLWNRSSRSVWIHRVDIISEFWQLLLVDGSLRWQPEIVVDRPVVLAPFATLRVRLEFTSVESQLGAIESSRLFEGLSQLVLLVMSSRPPLAVRWDDPLRRLRDPSSEELRAARELCRQGPLSTHWEIIRRPREFDLFPEFQPCWREDLSRVTPRDIQTQLPDNSLPWEGSSQFTHTEEARLDAGPGVFAILMQSASRRR